MGEDKRIYESLTARFDVTHERQQAGQTLRFLTGEQVVSRLNKVLGVFGWSFETVETVRDAEADTIMCRGRLSVFDGGDTPIVREQWGSQEIKRRRDNNAVVNIGDDYKAAATDALKKCASLLGVGLYLLAREAPAANAPRPVRGAHPPPRPAAGARAPGTTTTGTAPVTTDEGLRMKDEGLGTRANANANGNAHPSSFIPHPSSPPPVPSCEECKHQLRTYTTRGGKRLAPGELAKETMTTFGRVLCGACASKAVAK